ncbi:hypothetical protein PFISCL1PPCAC_6135, partial [Pristionchus fissidentatus]
SFTFTCSSHNYNFMSKVLLLMAVSVVSVLVVESLLFGNNRLISDHSQLDSSEECGDSPDNLHVHSPSRLLEEVSGLNDLSEGAVCFGLVTTEKEELRLVVDVIPLSLRREFVDLTEGLEIIMSVCGRKSRAQLTERRSYNDDRGGHRHFSLLPE